MATPFKNPMPPAGKRRGVNDEARVGQVPTTPPGSGSSFEGSGRDIDPPGVKEGSLADRLLDLRQQRRGTASEAKRYAQVAARGGDPRHPANRAATASRQAVSRATPVVSR